MPQVGLMKQEARSFLGVNLRTERVDLADEELAKSVNADLHTQPGSIVIRLGRTKQFSSALTDLVIRRLAKINSRRYQVAGTSVYRDQTSILTGLSSNLITTLLGFRPLNDTTEWAFIADDSLMRKDNGTTVRIWGIAAATTTPTLAAGAAPGVTGNYTARYIFVRKVGTSVAHQSNPSPTPIVLALTAQHIVINLENTTDPQVTHVRFYRTVASGASHLFEAEMPFWDTDTIGYAFTWEAAEVSATNEHKFTIASADGNTQCCFAWEKDHVDSAGSIGTNSPVVATVPGMAFILAIGDSALGGAVETDNDRPPNASWCVAHQEHVFLCRDASNPHYLWFSKRFRPESFPAGTNFLEIANPSDPLQCAVANAGMLGVFSRLTKYRVLGNATSGFVHQEALSRRGTPAPMSCVPTELGAIFVARDGVFATNFVAPDVAFGDPILPLFFGETVNGMSPINWSAVSTMAAATYKNKYYLAYPSGTNTNPDRIAVFSNDTKKWYHYDHPMRSLFVEEDVDDLVGGSTDGFVYILEDGTDDAGTSISMDVETKDYVGESPTIRRLFRYLRVDADVPSGTLTANFYVDGTLKRAASVTGSRTKALLPLPEAAWGYQWRVNFTYTGTGRVRIYGVAALWLPLGAS